MKRTFFPVLANHSPKLNAKVVLPTPPLIAENDTISIMSPYKYM